MEQLDNTWACKEAGTTCRINSSCMTTIGTCMGGAFDMHSLCTAYISLTMVQCILFVTMSAQAVVDRANSADTC